MRIELRLEGDKSIANKVNRAIKDSVKRTLQRAAVGIERRIRLLIQNRIRNTDVWQSLQGGTLQLEFGLVDPVRKLNAILDIWVNSINIKVQNPRQVGDAFKGGLKIHVLDGNYNSVLSAPEAKQVIDDGELPWLEWLLKFGDTVIVRDYEVQFRRGGRLGRAVMVTKPGATWRVPPQFSGTITNNFITRALEGIEDKIKLIIKEEIEKKIK